MDSNVLFIIIRVMLQSVDLGKILSQSQYISQQLSLIKRELADGAASCKQTDSASKYIERAINLRLAFRNLADGIETNRGLVQVQKEKIEKGKIYIEGMHYYRVQTTIEEKIRECEVELVNVSDYVDKPVDIGDWVERFEEQEGRLAGELGRRREQQELYEGLVAQKARKEQEIREKRELYERVLPSQAKKILEQIQETSRYFGVEDYEQFEGIANHQLSVVFDRLSALRSRRAVQVRYSCEQFEEIEVVVCREEHRLYRQAAANRVGVAESELKLTISSIAPHYNRLVLGLDRREDFSNEEVFQRLVNHEPTLPIFPNPQNELERNLNAKYVRLDWFHHLFLRGILTPEALLELIRERVFCLKLLAFITDNIKKLSFFFPLHLEHENAPPTSIKKVSLGSLEKVPFQVYAKEAHCPQWLQKYVACLPQGQDILLPLLGQFRMEEAASPFLNSYYKGCLTVYQNVLEFFLIVPLEYPRAKSYIRVTAWHRRKEEEKKVALDLPCKLAAKVQGKGIPLRILALQRAVNQEISPFFKGEEANSPFRILIQINRLLTLLADGSKQGQ